MQEIGSKCYTVGRSELSMDESYQCLNVSLLGSTGMPTGHEQVCWQNLMFRIFRVVHNGWLELHTNPKDFVTCARNWVECTYSWVPTGRRDPISW